MPSISSPPADSTAWLPGRIGRSSMCRLPTPSRRRKESTRPARWCARRAASISASAMSDRESLEAVADEFWAFSLDLYAHPDVAAACLRLQDEQGLDVNLLLLCCWLARSGRGRLGEGDLAAAEARAAPWRRDIIGPLRAVRRALKTMADSAPPYAESQ